MEASNLGLGFTSKHLDGTMSDRALLLYVPTRHLLQLPTLPVLKVA